MSLLARLHWHTFRRVGWAVVILALFVTAVPGIRPDPHDGAFQTLGHARYYLFDFTGWEIHALSDKALNALVAPQRYMDEGRQTQTVRRYFQLVNEIHQLEARVETIYADPHIADREAASAPLRARRDALRATQREQQALVESIVEVQVSKLLAEYGFEVGGQVLPPVAVRFTELPVMLIVSPRARIERIGAYPLAHGLTVEQMEAVEASVDADLGVSSLVVPIGGLAVWPAMLIETGYLPSAIEAAAHEWAHHYLTFFPLGFNYDATPETITINETVASIVGTEIGWAVLDRYYPDLAPPPPDYAPLPPTNPGLPADGPSPAFDFRAEMRTTRVHVDELLAAGRIQEAEQYMQARRVLFVENGYAIRKLNQAYFAFYGSYADEPGAAGADPIGPALRELRFRSASLADFIRTVRGLTSLADIQRALDERRPVLEAGG